MHWLDSAAGGVAALGAALFWASSTAIWGLVAHRVPPQSLIVIRTTLAGLALGLCNYVLSGTFWPADISSESMLLLAVSGWLAMNVGDYFFFKAVPRVGPRLFMLVFTATPIVTAAIAWLAMGEPTSLRAFIAIALIVGGIAWVVSEPRSAEKWASDSREFRRGIALTIASLLAVGASYVCTRAAVQGGPPLFSHGPALAPVDGLQAAFTRLAAAAALGWVLLPFTRTVRPTFTTLANPGLMRLVVPATLLGLVFGSWLSTMALARVPSGAASALLSCGPIFMVPLSRLFFGERHSARALAGTALALAGVFLLLV